MHLLVFYEDIHTQQIVTTCLNPQQVCKYLFHHITSHLTVLVIRVCPVLFILHQRRWEDRANHFDKASYVGRNIQLYFMCHNQYQLAFAIKMAHI
jgi:ABC-type uncharacterized transport system permease subunit